MSPFWHGFEKNASALAHAAEIGGLGYLAQDVKKDWNSEDEEKRHNARKEGVGLGVLAAPSVVAAGVGGYQHAKAIREGVQGAKPGFSNALKGAWKKVKKLHLPKKV